MTNSLCRQFHVRTMLPIFAAVVSVVSSATASDFYDALTTGMTDRAQSLLTQSPVLLEAANDDDMTPLHLAVQQSNVAAVSWLLAHNANVNSLAYNKFTPLHLCVDGKIAEALIKAGADLSLADAWGNTSLLHAAAEGNADVVNAILASGCKLDLRTAIILKKRDVVSQLLRDEPSLAKQSTEAIDLTHCNTPLGLACSQKDKEIAELLLTCGANVNETTFLPNCGCNVSALTNAVWAGDEDVVKLLLKHGATTDVAGGKRYPAILDYARRHSTSRIVSLLECAGRSK